MRDSKFTLFITIVLAILTILLALNYYKDYQKIKKEEKTKTIFEKKIDIKKINKLIIYNPTKIEFVKKDGFWFLYNVDDIAYDYMVENILSSIYQPTVSDVIDFEKQYYDQFFKKPIDVYFTYNNELYHLQRGIKNDFTSETYLWIDLKDYKNKIYIVNYWDFNYLDKSVEEFRMKKLLNIDQEKVEKLIVNNVAIYKEEIVDKKNKKKKDEEERKKIIWKLSDGSFVSKEYINSLFAILNNYDFKNISDKNIENKKPLSTIKIFANNKEYDVYIYPYEKDEYVVRTSYRKYNFVFPKIEIEDFLKKEIIEKKIFSYYIDNFDDFDSIFISDSRARFNFKKKEGKWISSKNEEKTSQISLLFSTLRNLEYKQKFETNPINSKYELYTIELNSKNTKYKFYLYNTDYLAFGKEIYKIDPFVFILKDLLK